MPSIEKNLKVWSESNWIHGGDEWSDRWGGTENLWKRTVLPRIQNFIPVPTILEIAPGYGRCTQYLKDCCDHLIVVDLTPRCILACKERFATSSNITYHVNDGKSLAMIPEQSVDFVFSFDSLVHVDAEVIQSYLDQLGSILRPNGFGFIHHSNLGSYSRPFVFWSRIMNRLPNRLTSIPLTANLVIGTAGRGLMSAELFARFCAKSGLTCLRLELINWTNGQFLIDCFSTFTKQTLPTRRTDVIRNPSFVQEEASAARRHEQIVAARI